MRLLHLFFQAFRWPVFPDVSSLPLVRQLDADNALASCVSLPFKCLVNNKVTALRILKLSLNFQRSAGSNSALRVSRPLTPKQIHIPDRHAHTHTYTQLKAFFADWCCDGPNVSTEAAVKGLKRRRRVDMTMMESQRGCVTLEQQVQLQVWHFLVFQPPHVIKCQR